MVAALDGLAAYVAGDLELSMTMLRGAIDSFRALHDDNSAALFEISFSEVAELRGDIEGATAAMASALDIESKAGFLSSTVLRAVLCWLTGKNGEIERSLALGNEVVALAHQPFNPVIRAQALFALGVAETLANQLEPAATHLGEALEIHQRVGMTRETAMDHRHLGILRHLRGDRADAITHLRLAIELAVEVGLPWTVMLGARSLAQVIVDGHPAAACQLLGSTEALSEVFGYIPTDEERQLVDSTIKAATALIGAAAVEEATAAGAQVSHTELPQLIPS